MLAVTRATSFFLVAAVGGRFLNLSRTGGRLRPSSLPRWGARRLREKVQKVLDTLKIAAAFSRNAAPLLRLQLEIHDLVRCDLDFSHDFDIERVGHRYRERARRQVRIEAVVAC